MIRTLSLEPSLLKIHKQDKGQNCYVAKSPELEAFLKNEFGRPDLCLKIFRKLPTGQTPQSFLWSGATLTEATQVQNLFAMHGLARRVYAIVLVNGERLAQVTRYADGKGDADVRLAKKLARKYRIGAKRRRNVGAYIERQAKWIGRHMIDFGGFYFREPKWYEKRLQDHVIRYRKKKHTDGLGYQPCDELGIAGRRNISKRIKQMKLDNDDFSGKMVLDIGCNNGAFCRYAAERGAKRVVGVDHKYISGNRQLFNWLGLWNVDFIQIALPHGWRRIREKSDIKRFDIVFCLSVAGHVGGYASWIPALAGDVMYFSGQSVEPRNLYQKSLERDFREVRWLGYVRDEPGRRHPLWRCRRLENVESKHDREDAAVPGSGGAAEGRCAHRGNHRPGGDALGGVDAPPVQGDEGNALVRLSGG